jgi:hypothetical protein
VLEAQCREFLVEGLGAAGQTYYRRKRAEGKSAKEALRCLKLRCGRRRL